MTRPDPQNHLIATTILEYQGPEELIRPRVPAGLQFLFGLLMAYAYGLAVALTNLDAALMYMWAHVAVILGVAVLVRVRLKWKGFIPGVLVAILLSPVSFLIVCAILFSF